MRYFTTNEPFYLSWKWDGSALYYTGSDPRSENADWWLDGGSPEKINQWGYGSGDVFHPGDSLYAYETDENWNRL